MSAFCKRPQHSSTISWSQRVNLNLSFYFGTLLIFSVLNILQRLQIVPSASFLSNAHFSDYFQFVFSHLLLTILVGLSLDSSSVWAKFFSTKFMQFLGRISLSLYLSHVLVQFAIILFLYGAIGWDTSEIHNISAAKGQGLPVWAVPLHVIMSVIIASLSTLLFEEPLRAKLVKCFFRI